MNRSLLANKPSLGPIRRQPQPPAWATALVPFDPTGQAEFESFERGPWTLLVVRIDGARSLSDAMLRTKTDAAYRDIFRRLASDAYAVRFWNFIPAITETNDEGLNRYMAFNHGRFDAFQRLVAAGDFEALIPTASGVGHDGDDLLIYCLASDRPGTQFSNPRQINPHRYSTKYGPLPPCFARATRIVTPDNAGLLLVGGTASIGGEDTLHVGDLSGQLAETLGNLGALVNSVRADPEPLARFRELRVYYPRASDLSAIRAEVAEAFPNVSVIEYVRADLCRQELLVEIEGVAVV